MKYFTIITTTLVLYACGSSKKEEPIAAPEQAASNTQETFADTTRQQIAMPTPPSASDQYSFQVIAGEKGTFGYDIYVDGKKTISQPNIPAVAGTLGFSKKEDAEKVATMAIEKMKKGIMPPTIEPEELKKMGVIK